MGRDAVFEGEQHNPRGPLLSKLKLTEFRILCNVA